MGPKNGMMDSQISSVGALDGIESVKLRLAAGVGDEPVGDNGVNDD